MTWALIGIAVVWGLVLCIIYVVNYLDEKEQHERIMREAEERAREVPYWS